jgi:hypothetical protein
MDLREGSNAMRIIATVLFLGSALVAAPMLEFLGPAEAAGVSIIVGVVLAGLASEAFSPLSIALGALGAVAFNALAPYSPELAGGVLVTSALGARALRARTARWRGLHVLGALLSGCAAAAIANYYSQASFSIQAAAALVAGLVAAASILVPADDSIAYALVHLSGESPEPSRTELLRAAFLRRRVGEAPEGLSRMALKRLDRAWMTLVDAARGRLEATGATAEVLDKRIRAHVDALERLYTAANERIARAAGLTDEALAAARMEGEALQAEVAALTEVGENDVATPPEVLETESTEGYSSRSA